MLQQLIADGMAQRIVDGLEAIEVEEHHGDTMLAALCLRQRLLQPVMQQGAIGQAGQSVMDRRVTPATVDPADSAASAATPNTAPSGARRTL